jgi:DNA sulfur modification protein DndB
MSTLIPAIRSRMGSRDYYIAKMSASSLSGQVSIASELDDWENLTLDDLYQRDLNRKRVEQDIAPYLANTADRFFGSIIILIKEHDAITFEGVGEVFDNMLAAYRNHSADIGVLTIGSRQGGLVALDGQHRLAALRHVVQGNTPGPYRDDVADDEVAVIFISDTEISKARELFTMLNRSARKVSKNDVLIMSESDGAAIVARRLTGHLILNPRRNLENQPLVKWESNTIAQKDTQITTLNALYELAKIAAEFLGVDFDDSEENDDKDGPSEKDLDLVLNRCVNWLSILFECEEFARMREDSNLVVEGRKKESKYSLLLRPVGFILFFEAVAKALKESELTDEREVIERLLQIDWRLDSHLWMGIMVNTRKNVSNKASDINLASDLAVYLICGESIPLSFRSNLEQRIRKQYNRDDANLPSPLEF